MAFLIATRRIFAASLFAAANVAAAPYKPTDDQQILERLPAPSSQAELRALQAALAVKPADADLAAQLARRYFRLAMAEGDPRFIGYAQAALAPWWGSVDAPTQVLVMRALVKQYGHDFAPALADLGRAGERAPAQAEIWSWRAALHLVQADYAGARADCAKLDAQRPALDAVACNAWVDGLTGRARSAHEQLATALAQARDLPASERLWLETRLAELAARFGDTVRAEQHFRAALATNVVDQYLLAAYADFLLDQARPAEVTKLLRGWERADALLLRLAIAARAQRLEDGARLIEQLAARFAAAALRGDVLHQQEEARYRLELANEPAAALRVARANWARQREPRDARVFMEAALAAGDAAAAQPVLDWLSQSGNEDALLRERASRLRKP